MADLFATLANPSQFPDPETGVTMNLSILQVRPNDEEIEFEIEGISPFHTLDDLARTVWDTKGSDEWYPSFVFYAILDESGDFEPLMGTWYKADSDDVTDAILVPNPYTLLETQMYVEGGFVTASGDRGTVAFTQRNRMTIEDVLIKPNKRKGIDTNSLLVYAFTFNDLRSVYTGAFPFPPRDFFGQFYPYFPMLSVEGPFEMNDELERKGTVEKEFTKLKRKQSAFINTLIDRIFIEQPRGLKTIGYRYMTLQWAERLKGFEGVDTLFYGTPATERRPFMRLLMPSTTTMTKMYVPELTGKPTITDEELLRVWVQERSPSENDDFLFMKILLREKEGSLFPIYGTLRVYQDGTADFTLQPPKATPMLSFLQDTPAPLLSERVRESLRDLPYSLETVELARGTIQMSLTLDSSEKRLSKEIIRNRVQQLSTLFQEIPAPPGETPFLTLRYKGVSNFMREDRISLFLTQLNNREKGKDVNFVQAVAQEFQLSIPDAEVRVATWIKESTKITVADAETRDYKTVKNPGTDIVIYVQHPVILFHIYRLESLEDYERIYSLLYMLFRTQAQWGEVVDEEEAVQAESVEAAVVPLSTTDEKPVLYQDTRVVDVVGQTADAPDFMDDLFKDQDDFLDGLSNEAPRPAPGPAPAPVAVPAQQPQQPQQAPAQPKPAVAPVAKPKPKKTADDELVVADGYFLSRLQQLDPALFAFKKGKTSIKTYGSQCLASEGRQPAVLNEDQYNYMFEKVYPQKSSNGETDPRVGIITMGMKNYGHESKADYEAAKEKDYIFYVMRYGSDAGHLHYYLCAELFCLRDTLPITMFDFERTKDRQGRPKPENTCPFCYKKAIQNVKAPKPDEAILRRMKKPGSDSIQDFIGFLRRGRHPDGFDLPCCVVPGKKTPLIDYMKDEKFKRIRNLVGNTKVAAPVLPKKPAVAAAAAPELVEEDVEANVPVAQNEEEAILPEEDLAKSVNLERGKRVPGAKQVTRYEISVPISDDSVARYLSYPIVNYKNLLWKIGQTSILEYEKYPLHPGAVGKCMPSMDTYFAQDSEKLVHRPKITQEIKPNAEGFFRIGVLNTSLFLQKQSFFAALAPYLGFNTVKEVMDEMSRLITPLIFTQLNFGNLVLEFFDPEETLEQVIRDSETFSEASLFEWGRRFLGQDVRYSKFEVSRIYRSYRRFLQYIYDPEQVKQARHFLQALAEPGLFTDNGLTLVTLQYEYDPKENTSKVPIQAKCPILGYNIERFTTNDVGFISYSPSGIWEPLFYIAQPNIREERPFHQEAVFTIPYEVSEEAREAGTISIRGSRGSIFEKRLTEYATQCRTAYRGAYTFQSGVDSSYLLPLSTALEILDPIGIVRDIYNHIVAVTIDSTRTESEDENTRLNGTQFKNRAAFEKALKKRGIREVLVPVADDGILLQDLPMSLKLHLSFSSVKVAYAEEVLRSYNGFLRKQLQENIFYQITKFLTDSEDLVRAFRIGIKDKAKFKEYILLPCGPLTEASGPAYTRIADLVSRKQQFSHFEYQTNCLLYMTQQDITGDEKMNPCGLKPKGDITKQPPENPFFVNRRYVENLYQHIRLMFSLWLDSKPNAKTYIDEILSDSYLPVYEKRYRLLLEYQALINAWIVADDKAKPREDIFLRKPCFYIKDQSKCDGFCTWKQTDGKGKCYLHTPANLQIRSGPVDVKHKDKRETLPATIRVEASNFFAMRLVDELVRLPAMRYELMNKHVSRVQVPQRDIHVKDQWLIPESTPAWDELLRGTTKLREMPQYWEEFSRDYTSIGPIAPLPVELRPYITTPAQQQVRLISLSTIPGAKNPADGFLRVFPRLYTRVNLEDLETPAPTSQFKMETLKRLATYLEAPLVQGLLTEEEPLLEGISHSTNPELSTVVLYLPDAPGGGAVVQDIQTKSFYLPIHFFTPEFVSKIQIRSKAKKPPMLKPKA